jgi:acetyl esterase/lipase
MRLRRHLAAAAATLVVLAVVAWLVAMPRRPDAFYRVDGAVPPVPGQLLRHEPLAVSLPAGARAFRFLYATTRPDGTPAAASGVLVVPAQDAPAPVVAYAHGTTGVRPGCAPSLFADPFPNVPGFPALLEQGWAYVGTDYAGLGTEGGHLYLVGEDAARAVLDSVRAARQVPGLRLAPATVVWGHSQGGHAALWAGQRAGAYAPDVPLAGIAAVAPASNLPQLVAGSGRGPFGLIVSAYLADGYARAYPGLAPLSGLSWPARWLARDIAGRCIESPDALVSVAQTSLLPEGGLFGPEPDPALSAALGQNVPRGPFAAPVLIAQGADDDLVLPAIQQGYAEALCKAGAAVDYRLYEGRDHVSVVAPGSPLTAALIDWTRARFDGEAADPQPCGGAG